MAMRSVPSAVADGCRHCRFSIADCQLAQSLENNRKSPIANRQSLHPSATADGTDLMTLSRLKSNCIVVAEINFHPQTYSLQYLNLRDRMNFPGGCAPVGRSTRRSVFRFARV